MRPSQVQCVLKPPLHRDKMKHHIFDMWYFLKNLANKWIWLGLYNHIKVKKNWLKKSNDYDNVNCIALLGCKYTVGFLPCLVLYLSCTFLSVLIPLIIVDRQGKANERQEPFICFTLPVFPSFLSFHLPFASKNVHTFLKMYIHFVLKVNFVLILFI